MPTSGEGRSYHDENVTCERCGLYQTALVIYDVDDNTRTWVCTYCEHDNPSALF